MRPCLPVSLTRLAALILAPLLLSQCATPPRMIHQPTAEQQFFHLRGRFKLTDEDKRSNARFLWNHQPQQEEVLILTPLGTTAARMTIAAGVATLETPNKKYPPSPVADATRQFFGTSLPLDELPKWILGRVPATERDALGRPQRATVGLWQVDYLSFTSEAADALPQSLHLQRDATELLLLLDEWTLDKAQ